MKTSRKKLPIGIENFAELQTEEFYYVDKTGLIRDLLSHWAKVNLFTRPRRFGKSLNMSMLKTFFELETDKSLFQNLRISEEKSLCEEYMGEISGNISINESNKCRELRKSLCYGSTGYLRRSQTFSVSSGK